MPDKPASSSADTASTMAEDGNAAQAKDMLSDLYELIEALDRRVPRLERSGELRIAHDAADLRERAVSLIQKIEGNRPME